MERKDENKHESSQEVESLKKRVLELESTVAECKRAEEQALVCATKLGYLTKYANDFIILLDKDFYFLEVNERMVDFYGYSRQELIGMHAAQVRTPDTQPYFSEQVKPAQISGRALYETMHQRKDGTRFPVEISLRAISIQGDTFYQAVIRDITERKKAENQLQESYERYQNLYENMKSGVVVYRPENQGEDFIILSVNRAAEYSSRIHRSKVIGKSVLEAFPEVKQFGLLKILQQVYKSGKAQHYPVVLYDGQRVFQWTENYVYKLLNGEIVVIYDDISEAKIAEDKIKEDGKFLDTIIENIPDMVFVKEAKELRYIRFNHASQKFLGYSTEELFGKNDFDFLPKKIAEISTEKDRAVLDGKKGVEIPEEIIRNRSQEKIVMHTKKIPILDDQGKPIYLLSISEDITERKKAEESLRSSEQLLEGIMNTIPVRVFWKDKNLVYLGCNAIFAKDAGFSDAKEVIGKNDYQLSWHDEAESYRNDDLQVIQSGNPKLLIEEIQTKPGGGQTITLLTNKIPLRDSSGEIIGVLGSYLDITERKKMENALRDAEIRYRLLFELSPEGIVIIDPQTTKIIEFNEVAYRQLGYSREEFARLSISDLEVLESPQETRRRVSEVVSGKREDFETQQRCKNGEIKDIYVIAQIVEILGRPVYYCVWRDISERKKIEEENSKRAKELEIFYQASIGREERIIELKREIENLKKELRGQ